MKLAKVVVPWVSGLHLRPATQLVRLVRASKSVVLLKVGAKVADARSLLAILLLCTGTGMVIELEISGDDEEAVLASLTRVFASETLGDGSRGCYRFRCNSLTAHE